MAKIQTIFNDDKLKVLLKYHLSKLDHNVCLQIDDNDITLLPVLEI